MRISLLQQREPIDTIVEKTMARFWSRQYGQQYSVSWNTGGPASRTGKSYHQTWLVNANLNAIFTPDVKTELFDPIRREFLRSPSILKRPLQHFYVQKATTRAWARWLSHATISVSPSVPNARCKIIIPGNHKIRLLDQTKHLAYGILKHGFTPYFINNELSARKKARAIALPVPPLEEVNDDATWFSEQYISGTPVNRLAKAAEVTAALSVAVPAIIRLLKATMTLTDGIAYIEQLTTGIDKQIKKNPLLSSELRQNLFQLVEQLALRAMIVSGDRFWTAFTHGDFQPANILVNSEGVWITDWEYADRRQAAYDLLVYTLSSRSPKGLARRLQLFVENGPDQSLPWAKETWQDLAYNQRHIRSQHGSLFLLEELHLHLMENSQPLFRRIGQGLQLVITESILWLNMRSTNE